MARGKHTASAAIRREENGKDARIAALENDGRRLRNEIQSLQEARRADRDAHDATVRRMGLHIEENTSEALLEARKTITRLRDDLADARKHVEQIGALWSGVSSALLVHFEGAHGILRPQATDAVYNLMRGDDLVATLHEIDPESPITRYLESGERFLEGETDTAGVTRLSPEMRVRLFQGYMSMPGMVWQVATNDPIVGKAFGG
jgi:hypothetical protein